MPIDFTKERNKRTPKLIVDEVTIEKHPITMVINIER
jgi:hypothetical protein